MDCVDQAALLANFLEKPGRHAATEGGRQHRGGIIIRVAEHQPGKTKNEVQLFEIAVLAPVAAGIARRLGGDGALGRQLGQQFVGEGDELLVMEIAGRRQHHALRAIMVAQIVDHRIPPELAG